MCQHQRCSVANKGAQVEKERHFQELLDSYLSDKTLVHHYIQFQLEGEEAVDIDGVTREVFTIFFQHLMEKFDGESEKVPSLIVDCCSTLSTR